MPIIIRLRFVIAYDIVSDANRTKLSNLLQDYGDRVQKSVFEADLSTDEAKIVLKRASQFVDTDDSLILYPMCSACKIGIKSVGRERPQLATDLIIV